MHLSVGRIRSFKSGVFPVDRGGRIHLNVFADVNHSYKRLALPCLNKHTSSRQQVI